MRNCPNIDKDTLNAVKKMGIVPNVKNRMILFYTLCIVLRLFIAGLAYHFRDSYWLPYLVLVIGLYTAYRIYKNLNGNEWWSRKFHLIIVILLCIVSVLIILKKVNGKYISYLLYLDVFVGFSHSLFITRC